MKRKILVSPEFGAGWSSWNNKGQEFTLWMLTYQPIIEYLEGGGTFERDAEHPLLQRLQEEAKEKFGVDYVCVLGACSLQVVEVEGLFRIREYDGFESVETKGAGEWL